MRKFCTKCGRELPENNKCPHCVSTGNTGERRKRRSLLMMLLTRMGIGVPNENSANVFEKGQKIVPDIVKADENEVPVKEYDMAFLRSRIRGQYARGRLQITNKRILFRAAGMSYQGPIAQQYEFAVDEIAGVEIRKSNRISILNIFLCFWLNAMIMFIATGLSHDFAEKMPVFASICTVFFAFSCIIPFFVLRRKFWLKLIIMSFGLGALFGLGSVMDISLSTLLNGLKTNVFDYLYLIMFTVWVANVVLVSMVPDAIILIKVKGAAEAISIRRKLFATPFRQAVEYTGFGEVAPGRDFDKAVIEVGALINDLNTLGDLAVDKWKEKE